MEKFGLDKVVGRSLEQEKLALIDIMHESYKNQDGKNSIKLKELLNYEIPKTNEQYQTIQIVNKLISRERLKYRSDTFEIPPKNIHIVEQSKFKETNFNSAALGNMRFTAYFVLPDQATIFPDNLTKIEFLTTLSHEAAHFTSHNALKLDTFDGSPSLSEYRTGIMMRLNSTEQLNLFHLNEAVTETISRRVVKEALKETLFTQENKSIEDKRTIFASTLDEISKTYLIPKNEVFMIEEDKHEKDALNTFVAYIHQTKLYRELLLKIARKGNYDINTVQTLFERCYFTGKSHELIGTIDELFGSGTFRKIAEADNMKSDISKVRNIIHSLN